MRRRRLLALAGSTLPAVLAGCTGTSPNGDDSADGEQSETDSGGDTNETGSKDQSTEDSEPTDTEWAEPDWPTGPYADYDTTIVEVEDNSGAILGKLKAAVAHPGEQWQLGLSAAKSMPENGGMLFESDGESDLTFWMKDMSFGLDIVYVDGDRRITSIHHAPEPADDDSGTEQQYRFSGSGQYVLETNYNWTADHGITKGDTLKFRLSN